VLTGRDEGGGGLAGPGIPYDGGERRDSQAARVGGQGSGGGSVGSGGYLRLSVTREIRAGNSAASP
jgi:hypothetical protein